ncbi:MAG: FHA domain-containing protein [Thermoleophilia bacterium]
MVARLEAERGGHPFLVYRDGGGAQHVVVLDAVDRLVMGRRGGCEVCMDWDGRVSRVHAKLERVADDWTVVDDGLSRNGTFVNGQRVQAQHRLSDRDVIRMGHTTIQFRSPHTGELPTAPGTLPVMLTDLTDTKLRILAALCRPLLTTAGMSALPATNEQVAGEVHLSVEAVKGHLRELYRRFGIEDLPQNEKRLRLARSAINMGLVRGGERR